MLICLAASLGGRSHAQEADPVLDEIIVTATKRDESLQRVSASISALGAEDIEARQIQTIESLAHSMPNVAYTLVAAVVPNFSIRGVSPDGGSPIMEGTVALHIDGVYQPRMNMLELALADLQSAEILRGPQGTLYGRNASAGVINLNTKRPGREIRRIDFGVRGQLRSPRRSSICFRTDLADAVDATFRNVGSQ